MKTVSRENPENSKVLTLSKFYSLNFKSIIVKTYTLLFKNGQKCILFYTLYTLPN